MVVCHNPDICIARRVRIPRIAVKHSRPEAVSREQGVTARAAWSAIDAVANPVSTLVMLAGLVRTLSAADYGTLVIALAASGLSMAVNPAIAATTTKFVSEYSGRKSVGGRTVAGVITTSLIAVVAIDLILLLGTAIFVEPISGWVFGNSVSGAQGRNNLLLLAVLAVGIQQVDVVLVAAIRGLERFRRQALIEIVSRALLTAAVVITAWYTRSIYHVLFAQCVVCLISLAVRAAFLRALLPDRRLFQLSAGVDVVQLLQYGGWMWLIAIAGAAYTSVDRIIIGRDFGPATAGQYNIYVQIAQLIHFIPSSLFAFSLPAFSRLAAQGGSGTIARTYRSYLAVIGVTAIGIAAALIWLWPLLLKVLTGSVSDGGQRAASDILIINFLLLAFNIAPYYLLLAMGRSKTVSIVTTASILVSLAFTAILIPAYGLKGAAIARLIYGVGSLALLERAYRLVRMAGDPARPQTS
jgi:O-antigen/teichoic acid export membrane protein